MKPFVLVFLFLFISHCIFLMAYNRDTRANEKQHYGANNQNIQVNKHTSIIFDVVNSNFETCLTNLERFHVLCVFA